MKIERKIRVFISSKCGGAYTVARQALKTLLEESGICEVYAFEKEYALSCPVVSAYLNELKDSEVVIVFIDNEDNVTDPVQSEINRARELNKRILFFFCDEKEKKPTVLQQSLKDNLLEKYSVCHSFADFPIDAYNSFFNDVTKLYRFTSSDVYENNDVSTDVIKEQLFSEFNQIKKETLQNINSVKDYIKKIGGISFIEERKYDRLEKAFLDLFKVVVGNEYIKDVDFSIIEEHWRDIYTDGNNEIIKFRKDALVKYLGGDFQEAYNILDKTINTYREKMPRWMLNDIAIDMRNIDMNIYQNKGVWLTSSKGQKILDEDNECIYNPLIDRFNSEFYQELMRLEFNNKLESPDTILLGQDVRAFDYLANTFIAAVDCLSITYIILIRNKISRLFALLSFKYRAHSLFLNAVKMFVLDGNEKELKKYVAKYGESSNRISSSDIAEMQMCVDRIQNENNRIRSQAMLLEYFAYYYDDDLFSAVKEKFFRNVIEAINDEKVIVFSDVIRTLACIERRVKTEEILDIIYRFIDSKFYRWHDDALKVISKINTLGELDKSQKKELLKRLEKWMSDKEVVSNCPNVFEVVQMVRLSLGNDANELDDYVKRYAPNFYDSPYSVNVYNHSQYENGEYIVELVKRIKEQNKIQGKDGVYSQYAYNDYLTIGNIIQNSNSHQIDYRYISKVINVIEETLNSETQTSEAKFFAVRLLIIIQLSYPRNRIVKKLLTNFTDFEQIRGNHPFALQNRYTNDSLEVMWKLSTIFVCGDDSDSFITDFHGCNEAEQIAIMDSICAFTKPLDKVNLDKLVKILWPSLLLFEKNESKKIRFFLAVIYANLYSTSYGEKALRRLIVLLENGTAPMKIGALSRLKSFGASGTLVDYLYQQGRVDNEYCVKAIANR